MSYSRRVSALRRSLSAKRAARLPRARVRPDRLTRRNAADHVNEVGAVGVLEHDRFGAGGQCGIDGGVVRIGGEEDHLRARCAVVDAPHDLGAEHVGEPQIEDHDVGLGLRGQRDRLASRAGVAGEADPRCAVDEVANAVEDDRVVVDHEDADRPLDGHAGTHARTVSPPSSFPPT